MFQKPNTLSNQLPTLLAFGSRIAYQELLQQGKRRFYFSPQISFSDKIENEMGDRERELLLSLLKDQRVASLAVLVKEHPYASLVPFAMTGDFSAALIHTSRLARHSEGLASGASFSLLIHEPDVSAENNPAQLARASLEGRVRSFERTEEAYIPARDLYLAKFPKSQITFDLADFTLHALQIERCRFVAGFAQTFNLTFAELSALT